METHRLPETNMLQRPTMIVVEQRHNANYSTTRLERKDSEVSPHTITKPPPTNVRGDIAPWDSDPQAQLNSYRNELSHLHNSTNIPSITQQPPSAIAPWASGNDKTPMATSIFGGTFYNDSNENLGQISPGFAPPELSLIHI